MRNKLDCKFLTMRSATARVFPDHENTATSAPFAVAAVGASAVSDAEDVDSDVVGAISLDVVSFCAADDASDWDELASRDDEHPPSTLASTVAAPIATVAPIKSRLDILLLQCFTVHPLYDSANVAQTVSLRANRLLVVACRCHPNNRLRVPVPHVHWAQVLILLRRFGQDLRPRCCRTA